MTFSGLMPHPSRLLFAFGSLLRLLALTLAGLSLLTAGCSNGAADNKGPKKRAAIPVHIAVSRTATLPWELGAIGHVESPLTAEIRSQVTGILKSVHFQEGDEVKADELLFSVDPRPFAANLAKVEALLAKDQADLDHSRRELARYAPAAAKGVVSAEQADQAATRVAALTAAVQADQAAVDSARLELEYCSIRAPFAGRTGEIQLDQGNLVRAGGDPPLTTLRRTDPILVAFTVADRHLQDLFTYRQAGSLAILAREAAHSELPPLSGQLEFIDNTIDPTSGVIRLKAAFANPGKRLWPGQLIDVRIRLTERANLIVVPSQAVQTGQQGAYVYVLKSNRTVAFRPVTPGMRVQGETVIEAGLAEGEKVVVDGQMQLADGAAVEERDKGKERAQP